jgi:phosphoribosylanthranilate isomerase
MPIPAKICGLTRPQDAEAALRFGASYLGMIFAGGPRQVSSEQARAVVQAAAGQVPVFGVFSSQTREEILEVRDITGLDGAQLHQDPAPALVEALLGDGMRVLVVARLSAIEELDRLGPFLELGAPILVEPKVAGRLGGTGTALSHDLARQARSHLTGHTMFLAGGLTADSVADAVRAARPDAVDVSSGVEQIPGIKDHDRLARFLEVLRWL